MGLFCPAALWSGPLPIAPRFSLPVLAPSVRARGSVRPVAGLRLLLWQMGLQPMPEGLESASRRVYSGLSWNPRQFGMVLPPQHHVQRHGLGVLAAGPRAAAEEVIVRGPVGPHGQGLPALRAVLRQGPWLHLSSPRTGVLRSFSARTPYTSRRCSPALQRRVVLQGNSRADFEAGNERARVSHDERSVAEEEDLSVFSHNASL